MQNRIFKWRRSTNAHASFVAPQCTISKPFLTTKSLNQSVGMGITMQHNCNTQKSAIFLPAQVPARIQNTIEHYRHLLFTLARHKLLSQCSPLFNMLLHRNNPPRLAIKSFSNTTSARFCICAISHFASQQ